MDITLTPDEAQLLKKILESFLSDLRVEVADTEKYEWRKELQKDEETIKGLIARLG